MGDPESLAGDPAQPAATAGVGTLLKFAFLSFGVIVFGTALGIQGAFPALEERGFFSDLCHASPNGVNVTQSNASHSGACPKQREALSRTTFAALAFINICAFFNGVLVERISGAKAFSLAGCLGGCGWLIMMIHPSSGIGFALGVFLASVAATMSALAALSDLTPKLFMATPHLMPIAQAIYTSVWDLSVLMPVPLGYLIADKRVPLETTFLMMGLLQLLCAAVCIPVFWRKQDRTADSRQPASSVQASTPPDEQPTTTPSAAPSLKEVFRQLRQCLRRAKWVFGAVTVTATATVTYSSYAMSNIGLYAAARGESSHVAEREFTLVIGGVGCVVAIVLGKLFGPLQQAVGGSQRAFATVSLIQVVLFVIVGVLVGIENTGSAGLWTAYVLIVIARMIGFTAVNVGWTMVVVENKLPGAGSSFSLIYTVAGVLALIFGLVVPAAVDTHDHQHFVTVHSILVGICGALAALGSALAATQVVASGAAPILDEATPILADA